MERAIVFDLIFALKFLEVGLITPFNIDIKQYSYRTWHT